MSDNIFTENARSRILLLIKVREGMKSQELLLTLLSEYPSLTHNEIKNLILDMVSKKQMIEIEYHISGKTSRSLFVPSNTRIEISK